MELTKKILNEINASLSLNVNLNDNETIKLGYPSIDSRNIKPGETFFGIMGKSRNGCDFFEDAIKNGANVVVLTHDFRDKFEKSEIARKTKTIGIFVNDTKIALRQLGFTNRLMHQIPFIAITGSNGKTTTKELVSTILSKKYKVFKTEGNFNNELGLPMQLLKLDKSYEVGVTELGMSAPGEIDLLASLVLPKIGIITCVGPSHIEFLKTLKNIAKAKAELINKIDKSGYLILNFDNIYTRKMASQFSGKVIGYSIENRASLIQAKNILLNSNNFYEFDCYVKDFKNYPKFKVSLNLAGRHNILNALAAISVALIFDISVDDIINAISEFNGVQKRMELIKLKDNITILNDCYNASPLSMRMALETCLDFKPQFKRQVAILGDMLELGSWTKRSHIEIGKLVNKIKIDYLITVGKKAKYIAESAISDGFLAKNTTHFENSEIAALNIKNIIQPGDFILIKGSRGIKLEKVLEKLLEEK